MVVARLKVEVVYILVDLKNYVMIASTYVA